MRQSHVTEPLRYGTHCKGSHSVTYTTTHLSANAFPVEAGPNFSNPRGMEG